MKDLVDLDAAYGPSDDVVVREIEGEIIIVPLTAGIGDIEDELYTLNETGKAVWKMLDGRTPVRDIIRCLSAEFEDPAGQLEQDVVGLVGELVKRKMVVRKT